MVLRNTLLFILLFILSVTVGAATKKIHVWRDKDGVLVFSDTPNPNPNTPSKEITLNDDVITIKTENTDIFNRPPAKPKAITYKIEITTPTHEETVRDNTGSVHVTSRVMPSFKSGHKVKLLMDGKLVEKPQASSVFALRNVDRGAHTVQVVLLNDKGKQIAASESVTFFMHRAKVGI